MYEFACVGAAPAYRYRHPMYGMLLNYE